MGISITHVGQYRGHHSYVSTYSSSMVTIQSLLVTFCEDDFLHFFPMGEHYPSTRDQKPKKSMLKIFAFIIFDNTCRLGCCCIPTVLYMYEYNCKLVYNYRKRKEQKLKITQPLQKRVHAKQVNIFASAELFLCIFHVFKAIFSRDLSCTFWHGLMGQAKKKSWRYLNFRGSYDFVLFWHFFVDSLILVIN